MYAHFLNNPLTLKVGDEFEIQVLYEGQPVSPEAVTAIYDDFTESPKPRPKKPRKQVILTQPPYLAVNKHFSQTGIDWNYKYIRLK